MRRLLLLAVSACAEAAPAEDPSKLPESYTVAVTVPAGGALFMVPLGMNEAGQVVGYAAGEAWDPLSRPVRIAGGQAVVLDVPEANYGFANGISSAGLVAGTFQWQPQVWDSEGRHPLAVPEGWFSGVAYGATATGVIAGSYADYDDALPPNPVGPRPCYWPSASATPQGLALLEQDRPNGGVLAVNDSGQLAGWLSTSTGATAVLWESPDAEPTPIAPAEDPILSEARGISSAGDVAGRVTFEDFSSVAWWRSHATGASEQLPFLTGGGRYAEAWDVNRWGHVAGLANLGEIVHAVVWHEGQAIDLNDRAGGLPAGVRYLSAAIAISDSGFIAAEAVMESGFGDSVRHVALLAPAP
jgi:hypothetical protein